MKIIRLTVESDKIDSWEWLDLTLESDKNGSWKWLDWPLKVTRLTVESD